MTDPLRKLVNGRMVAMSPEEEATFRATLPVDPVPPVVSRAQGRIALLRAELLSSVETAIAASGDAELKIWWADAQEFRRDSPRIAAIGAALNLTAAQIDALFRQAATVT